MGVPHITDSHKLIDLSTRSPQKASTPFLFTISLESSHSSRLTPFSTFLTEEAAFIKPTRNPLPSQWIPQGMLGVRHITDSRKLIFTLDLSKKINPFPLYDLREILTVFSHSFSTFLSDVSSSSFSSRPETSRRVLA